MNVGPWGLGEQRRHHAGAGGSARGCWDWAMRLGLPAAHRIFAELRELLFYEGAGIDVSPDLEPIRLELAEIESELLESGCWPQMAPGQVDGEFRVGETTGTRSPVYCGVTTEELARGVLVAGTTGAGKTVLVTGLALQVLRRGDIRLLIVDPKGDYVCLAREFPEVDVYQDLELDMNLLEPPPGIAADIWHPRCAQILASAFGLYQGSLSTLTSAIRYAARLCDEVAEEGAPLYPTCAQIRDLFSTSKPGQYGYTLPGGRTGSDYTVRNRTRFENLCDTFPRIASVSSGIQIDGSRSTVVDLSSIGQATATKMLAESIVMRIYFQRLLLGHRPGRIDLLVVIDEAQMLVGENQEYQDPSTFPVVAELATRAREFGIGIAYLVQSPAGIMRLVRANTSVQVAMALNDGTDLDLMARTMSLSPEQAADMRSLQIGDAIIKKQGIPSAFRAHLDYHAIEKHFPVEDVRNHMAPRLAEETIIEGPSLDELWDRVKKRRSTNAQTDRGVQLTQDQETVLRFVLETESQHLGKSEFARRAPVERDAATGALDALVETKMIYPVSRKAAPGSGRGRSRICYYLDNDGARYLGLERDAHRAGRFGKGGWFHRTLMNEAVLWWQQCGYQARMEHPVSQTGKTIDVVVENPEGGKRVAVEIECSSSDALSNIAKCLDAGFETVWVVPKNAGVRKVIERELNADAGLRNRAEGPVQLLRNSSDLFGREEL